MSKHRLDLSNLKLSAAFLFDTVGEIENTLQLKVLLFSIWLAQESGDEANPLTLQDFYTYPELMKQLGSDAQTIRKNLVDALNKNLEAGYLTGNNFEEIQKGNPFYLNTARGRQASQLLRSNVGLPSRNDARSEIFILYEENIGPLTPLIANALKDAEQEYSKEWLEEAIRIAVANNVRKWRYVQAILTNWKEEDRNGRDQRHAEEDYKQYTKGKYGKFIKS
jgi:DNA replication protein